MIFIETTMFSKYMPQYLSETEYSQLQQYLMDRPHAGDLIPGLGGIRKIRWMSRGMGKRGGIRVLYYWQVKESQIYLLTLYAKNEVTELSMKEKNILKLLVREWENESKS